MWIRRRPALAVLGLLAAAPMIPLGGCNAWQDRAEFAAPQSRWPATLTSPVAADAPPPPIAAQYCYRTLASVDCFTEAKPERITGYTGTYPAPDGLPGMQARPRNYTSGP